MKQLFLDITGMVGVYSVNAFANTWKIFWGDVTPAQKVLIGLTIIYTTICIVKFFIKKKDK